MSSLLGLRGSRPWVAAILPVCVAAGPARAARPHHARAAAPTCAPARKACIAAAFWSARACRRNCGRLPEKVDVDGCRATCRSERDAAGSACRDVADACGVVCPGGDAACAGRLLTCRGEARRSSLSCRARCEGPGDMRCLLACDRERARAEAACGFIAAPISGGVGDVPELPRGRPADLSILLDGAEQAVVAAADARAAALRSRPLRLWVGRPRAAVTV